MGRLSPTCATIGCVVGAGLFTFRAYGAAVEGYIKMSDDQLDDRLLAPAPPAPPEKKSRPPRRLWLKIFVLAAAVVVAVTVWLFLPRPAPRVALRAFLPDVCAARLEIHSPAAISRFLHAQDFFGQVPALPGWRWLQKLAAEQDLNLDAQITAIRGMLGQLNGRFGLNNCVALALGVALDNENQPRVAAILKVDNLGWLALKTAALFLPKTTRDGGVYRRLKIADWTADANLPDLYLAESRGYFIVATEPQMLAQFRFADPAPTLSHFPAGEQRAIELTLKTAEFLPSEIVGAPSDDGEIFIWWDYKKFGGEMRRRVASPFAAEKITRVQPAAGAGLFFDVAMPRSALRHWRETVAALAAAGILSPTVAAVLSQYQPSIELLLRDAGGAFSAQLTPTGAAGFWTTADGASAESAAQNFALAVKQLLAPPPGDDFFSSLATSALTANLLTVRAEARRVWLRSPLIAATVVADFTAPASIKLDGATVLPPQLIEIDNSRGAARLTWSYAPQLPEWLRFIASQLRGGLRGNLAIITAFLPSREIAAVGEKLSMVADVLDSLRYFDAHLQTRAAPANGAATEISLKVAGELRLP
ncbi:hypothetical protein FACS1894139_03710 [Planctomycetales bacterium]|nr:hypothetical protein FACS1894139_03710 [Planctomycetales bacterium]